MPEYDKLLSLSIIKLSARIATDSGLNGNISGGDRIYIDIFENILKIKIGNNLGKTGVLPDR